MMGLPGRKPLPVSSGPGLRNPRHTGSGSKQPHVGFDRDGEEEAKTAPGLTGSGFSDRPVHQKDASA
jgi:hypothetical protein